VKIVIVGGSAPSTPNLFHSLAAYEISMPVDFVLTGRSPESLQPVQRACTLASVGTTISVSSALQHEAELYCDADLIIIQARFGGLQGREFDESFSLDFDICGDEGLGPGGLSAAWRGWPQMAETLEKIENEAPPFAKIVLLSAPLALYTRCAKICFPNLDVVGLCELPWTTLQYIASLLGCSVARLQYDYLGSNHVGWFSNIRLDDTLVFKNLIGAHANAFPSAKLLERIGAYPLKYLELVYERENVLRRQRSSISRGRQLLEFTEKAKSVFDDGSNEEVIRVLRARSTPWYDHAVSPFILEFMGINTEENCFFLTTTNSEYTSLFANEEIMEVPHRFVAAGKHCKARTNSSRDQTSIAETLADYFSFENKAAKVICERDESSLSQVLALHPWLKGSMVTAEVLARRILSYESLVR
jgi:6-phospho-beta-glucosidase